MLVPGPNIDWNVYELATLASLYHCFNPVRHCGVLVQIHVLFILVYVTFFYNILFKEASPLMLLALSHCTSVLATDAFQCTIQFESLVCISLHSLCSFIACLLCGNIGYLFIVYTNTF